MVDNEFAYELTHKQASVIDLASLLMLVNLKQDYFNHVRTTESPVLQEIDKAVGGCLLGMSMFRLPPIHAARTIAHIDKNLNTAIPSRDCALNFVLGKQESYAEWWTDNDVEVREHGYTEAGAYRLQFFPCETNSVRFTLRMAHPTLIETNIPHLGYSIPQDGLLLSLGFTRSFTDMRQWFLDRAV